MQKFKHCEDPASWTSSGWSITAASGPRFHKCTDPTSPWDGQLGLPECWHPQWAEAWRCSSCMFQMASLTSQWGRSRWEKGFSGMLIDPSNNPFSKCPCPGSQPPQGSAVTSQLMLRIRHITVNGQDLLMGAGTKNVSAHGPGGILWADVRHLGKPLGQSPHLFIFRLWLLSPGKPPAATAEGSCPSLQLHRCCLVGLSHPPVPPVRWLEVLHDLRDTSGHCKWDCQT